MRLCNCIWIFLVETISEEHQGKTMEIMKGIKGILDRWCREQPAWVLDRCHRYSQCSSDWLLLKDIVNKQHSPLLLKLNRMILNVQNVTRDKVMYCGLVSSHQDVPEVSTCCRPGIQKDGVEQGFGGAFCGLSYLSQECQESSYQNNL